MKKLRKGVLIVGPTGSGKSPIGNYLAETGRYVHFDFGARLRELVKKGENKIFTEDEIDFIKKMLDEKSLLPKEKFDIARKLLRGILDISKKKTIILNGFPRTPYQAEQLSEIINICKIVHIECTEEDIYRRVESRRNNNSDDHSMRDDDSFPDVELKLKIYRKKTLPLLNWAKEKNIEIIKLSVDARSDMKEMAQKLSNLL